MAVALTLSLASAGTVTELNALLKALARDERVIAKELLAEDRVLARAAKELAEGAEAASRNGALARHAEELEKQGDLGTAGRLFELLAIESQASGTREGEKEARVFAKRSNADSRLSNPSSPDNALASSALNHLSKQDAVLLRDFYKSAAPASRISIVKSDVKRFVEDFVEGARAPELHLKNAARVDLALAAKWWAAPVHKRIFIMGSGEDAAAVRAWTKDWEKDGYVPFFYKFCEVNGALCDSKAVGALFQSSGRVFIADSSRSQVSRYLPHEMAAARQLKGNGQAAILISTDDILNVAAGGAAVSMLVIGYFVEQPQRSNNKNKGSALGWVLAVVLGSLSLFIWRVLAVYQRRRREDPWPAGESLMILIGRKKVARLFLIILAIGTGCAYATSIFHDQAMILGALAWYSGIAALYYAILLVPGVCYIYLTPPGFIACNFFRRRRLIKWECVCDFQVVRSEHGRVVKTEQKESKKARSVKLSGPYDRTPEELAATMNEWRLRSLSPVTHTPETLLTAE